MTAEQIKSLNLDIEATDSKSVLMVESAIEWLTEHTTIDTSDITTLSASARLFISKYCEITDIQSGVASQSIEGLSQSFKSDNVDKMIWDTAYNLLGSKVESPVRFVSAKKRWR